MRLIRVTAPRCLLFLLLLLTFGNLPSFAQSSFGSIVGTVTDPSGGTIPGAKVDLTNTGTAERRSVTSDSSGNFSFVNVSPGNYKVEVEQPGFKRYSREPIRIEVESAVRVDAGLQVGDAAETVTVTAETPLLQTQSGTI